MRERGVWMFRIGGAVGALAIFLMVMVACLGTPTPESPIETPVSPIGTATPRPSPVGGDNGDVADGQAGAVVVATEGGDSSTPLRGARNDGVVWAIRREIGIAWDDPGMAVGWTQIGLDAVEAGEDVLTATVRISTGETLVFTGTAESGVVEIPEIDYSLHCDYRLLQDGETIQSGVILNSVRPVTGTGMYDPDAVPGTGIYATIEYWLPATFEGVAELWERCCWVASEPWPSVCTQMAEGVQDTDGYWMSDFVVGIEPERWWLPAVFRSGG